MSTVPKLKNGSQGTIHSGAFNDNDQGQISSKCVRILTMRERQRKKDRENDRERQRERDLQSSHPCLCVGHNKHSHLFHYSVSLSQSRLAYPFF